MTCSVAKPQLSLSLLLVSCFSIVGVGVDVRSYLAASVLFAVLGSLTSVFVATFLWVLFGMELTRHRGSVSRHGFSLNICILFSSRFCLVYVYHTMKRSTMFRLPSLHLVVMNSVSTMGVRIFQCISSTFCPSSRFLTKLPSHPPHSLGTAVRFQIPENARIYEATPIG